MITGLICGRPLPDAASRLRIREGLFRFNCSLVFLPRKNSLSKSLELHQVFRLRSIDCGSIIFTPALLEFLQAEYFYLIGFICEKKYLISSISEMKFLAVLPVLFFSSIFLTMVILQPFLKAFKFVKWQP